MTKLGKIQRWLLQLAVFLIPTNLAYHWYVQSAYLNGHLVDYLLPRIYLSDFPILGVIIIYVFNNRNIIYKSIISSIKLNPLPYTLLPIYLWNLTSSPAQPAGYWAIFKLIEFTLFGIAIINQYTKNQFLTTIRTPLLFSLLFQTIISLYQFINQNSLFGYFFMGEPSLESAGIVKNSYFGILEVAPYGTTPHPNVLAGFLTVGYVLFLLCSQNQPIFGIKKAAKLSLMGLILIILSLTQSLVAIGCFFIGMSLFLIKNKLSILNMRVLIQMLVASSLFLSPLIVSLLYHSHYFPDSHSILARYELNQASIRLWLQHPIFGVGPNQFIPHVPQTPLSGQKTLFLQPVHHLILLILVETGLVGLAFTLLLIWQFVRKAKMAHSTALHLVPLACLLIIGSTDHYPLTLQTGQLLLTFSLILPLLKN